MTAPNIHSGAHFNLIPRKPPPYHVRSHLPLSSASNPPTRPAPGGAIQTLICMSWKEGQETLDELLGRQAASKADIKPSHVKDIDWHIKHHARSCTGATFRRGSKGFLEMIVGWLGEAGKCTIRSGGCFWCAPWPGNQGGLHVPQSARWYVPEWLVNGFVRTRSGTTPRPVQMEEIPG